MNIIKEIAKLGVLKILSFLAGLLYSLLQIRFFGLNTDLDLYFVATTFVSVIVSISQAGQLGEFILPTYLHSSSAEGKHKALSRVNGILLPLLLFSTIVLISIYFSRHYLGRFIFSDFDNYTLKRAEGILMLSLPLVFLKILNSIYNTILNAERVFGRTEIINAVTAFLGIGLIYIASITNMLTIGILIVNLYISVIIELFWSLYILLKKGYSPIKVTLLTTSEWLRVGKLISGTFFYTGTSVVFNALLTTMVSKLPPGYYSSYTLAKRIVGKLEGFLLVPLTTVLFTEMNRRAEVMTGLNNRLWVLILMLPFVVILSFAMVFVLSFTFLPQFSAWIENFEYFGDYFVFYSSLIFLAAVSGLVRKFLVSNGRFLSVYLCLGLVQALLIIALLVPIGFEDHDLFRLVVYGHQSIMLLIPIFLYLVGTRKYFFKTLYYILAALSAFFILSFLEFDAVFFRVLLVIISILSLVLIYRRNNAVFKRIE